MTDLALVTDLERLVAIDAIRDLMARYVRYADHKDWRDLANTFLPDATFTSYDTEGNVFAEMRGRADIVARSRAFRRLPETSIHHLFSYEVEVTSPTTATGVFSMADTVIRPDDEPLVPDETGVKPFRTLRGAGHYHARYERVDGDWFIAELKQSRVRLEFTY